MTQGPGRQGPAVQRGPGVLMLYKTVNSICYYIQSIQGGPNHSRSMQNHILHNLTRREVEITNEKIKNDSTNRYKPYLNRRTH